MRQLVLQLRIWQPEVVITDFADIFHQRMIEKWNSRFDGRCHRHLVLLHKELVEISLHIGVQDAIEIVDDARRGGAKMSDGERAWVR
jgi:uncharacterized protein Usg